MSEEIPGNQAQEDAWLNQPRAMFHVSKEAADEIDPTHMALLFALGEIHPIEWMRIRMGVGPFSESFDPNNPDEAPDPKVWHPNKKSRIAEAREQALQRSCERYEAQKRQWDAEAEAEEAKAQAEARYRLAAGLPPLQTRKTHKSR